MVWWSVKRTCIHVFGEIIIYATRHLRYKMTRLHLLLLCKLSGVKLIWIVFMTFEPRCFRHCPEGFENIFCDQAIFWIARQCLIQLAILKSLFCDIQKLSLCWYLSARRGLKQNNPSASCCLQTNTAATFNKIGFIVRRVGL